MLKLIIPINPEGWDIEKEEFIEPTYKVLQLEHSLVSVSKWESKWGKPFLKDENRTPEEIIDYIKFMTITPNVDPKVYSYITNKNIEEINSYIDNPMSATTFSREKKSGRKEIVTSELIYYWMIACNIPFECQKWHLNRLLTLIKICNIKNQPPKKMSKNKIMSRNAAINAARRQQMNTSG